jgi:hypothetical protein
MHFDERDEGDFRIYAGAIESPHGGYTAAAVVKQVRGVPEAVEVLRDLHMSGGHAWDDPERALNFAMRVATEVIRARGKQMLAHTATQLPKAA